MSLAKIITAGIAGTTAMTIFSYYLSRKKGENFREPELLAESIIKISPSTGKLGSFMLGWIIHYLVGIFFAAFIHVFPGEIRAGLLIKFALTGGLTGIIAITAWRILLQLHPDSPSLYRLRFYGQLITAHTVFGMVTLFVLNGNRILVIGSPHRHRVQRQCYE